MEIIPVAPGVWDREGLSAQGAQLCCLELGGNDRRQSHGSRLASRWVLIPVHEIREMGVFAR